MKLLVITRVASVSVNDSLARAITGLQVQDIEVAYYDPRSLSVVDDDLKPFASSIILNDLADKISRSDYVILDSRMSDSLYSISLGMLYSLPLDHIFIFDNDNDFNTLSSYLSNRKNFEPFDSEEITVDLIGSENHIRYDELFYRLVHSKVNSIRFDETTWTRLSKDYVLLGLIWICGCIVIHATLDTEDPYFKALINRC